MGIREWVNDNSIMTTCAAVGILAAGLVFVLWHLGDAITTGDADAFFYDLEHDELFVASGTLLPPIETPRGGQRGVRAHVYSCDECSDDLVGRSLDGIEEEGAFVAWLERYPSDVKAALEASGTQDAGASLNEAEGSGPQEAELHGPLVRHVGDEGWVRLESRAGMDVIGSPAQHCSDRGDPILCVP